MRECPSLTIVGILPADASEAAQERDAGIGGNEKPL